MERKFKRTDYFCLARMACVQSSGSKVGADDDADSSTYVENTLRPCKQITTYSHSHQIYPHHTVDRLRNGEIDRVQSNYATRILMKTNKVVKAEEWKKKLQCIWIWFDYLCIPQTSHYQDISKNEKESIEKAECKKALKKAVESLPGYVELSDLMLILAPTLLHKNRKDPKTKEPYSTCLRSWRSRGWCVTEMLCAFLARHQKDLLVVTSSEGTWSRISVSPSPLYFNPTHSKTGTPFWGSPLDAVTIDLDRTNFTCCSLNHIMNGKPMLCDRVKVRKTLESIVQSKIETLKEQGLFFAARLCVYLKSVWCSEPDLVCHDSDFISLTYSTRHSFPSSPPKKKGTNGFGNRKYE